MATPYGVAASGPHSAALAGQQAVYKPFTQIAMKRRTEIVSFRADEPLLKRIDSARKPLILSRGEWVREVVITRFHDVDDVQQWPELANALLQADERHTLQIEQLYVNVRRQFIILMTQMGVPLEQAKEIARCKLSS